MVTPRAMVATALLLGAFVTAAGAYGCCYSLLRLRSRRSLRVGTYASCTALSAIAATLVVWTPLHVGWKVLIIASGIADLVIPPVTWRYLTRLHREEKTPHDSQCAQHTHRTVASLFRRA